MQGLTGHYELAERNINAKRPGFVLGKLRVGRGPRASGNRGRQWLVTRDDLERWSLSYGIRLPWKEGAEGDTAGASSRES